VQCKPRILKVHDSAETSKLSDHKNKSKKFKVMSSHRSSANVSSSSDSDDFVENELSVRLPNVNQNLIKIKKQLYERPVAPRRPPQSEILATSTQVQEDCGLD
jgi:hypothetical protein